jgi:hypothetical protein
MATDCLSLEEMWEQCQRRKITAVARENMRTPRELMSEFRSAGLLGNEPSDPTPDEIREGMEYFRNQWDAATEASRWIAARTTESVFV